MGSPATPDRAEWAERISTAWHGARAKFLEAGRNLIDAKKALAHGQFEAMVADDLPFTPSTARRLMIVAADGRLTDRAHGHVLPPAWRTLYELSKLDDSDFGRAISDGLITPDMTRQEAMRVRQGGWEPPVTSDSDVAAKTCTVEDLFELAASERRFGVILADVPWAFDTYGDMGRGRSPERHYPIMTLDDIKALPVGDLAAENCVLFLWAVPHLFPEALEVIEAWGFKYKTRGFLWVKENRKKGGYFVGKGYWTRCNPEDVFLATTGSPKRLDRGVEELVLAPLMEHSRKPAEIHRRIETFVGGPRLELFARRPVNGWTVWGNEIGKAEMERPNKG
ncbi:MAG: MT-A70 family methyltransferase [Alphaproteobacteria bacterium]|nr:MT-A70 family methyltransferase [Alphaproteobacteria bacterium]